MKKLYIIIFCLCLCITNNYAQDNSRHRYAPNQIIVLVKDSLYYKCENIIKHGNSELLTKDSIFAALSISKIERLHYLEENSVMPENAQKSFVFYSDRKSSSELMNYTINIDDIESADYNYIFYSTIVPDDTKYSDQWSLEKIKMPNAWELQKGCSDIKIAILDAGFRDLEHNDIDDKFIDERRDETDIVLSAYTNNGLYTSINGEDYTTPDNAPEGKSFHGLQVAGVAAAKTNNKKGIAGIGWNNYLIPVRCGFAINYLGEKVELLESDDIIRAIDWVSTNQKARIINMSFGGPIPQGNLFAQYENSLMNAYNNGIVLVAAAGNEHSDSLSYPASSQYTISVGATDENDNRTNFSNYGNGLDIVAPGKNILTLYRKLINQYTTENGTSFSAPIVSGVAALILSQNPELTPEQVKNIIIQSADKVSGMNGYNYHPEYGYGRINAKKALESVPEIVYNRSINNIVVNNMQIVYARNQIEASNYTMNSGSSVIFKAGNNIKLNTGFKVNSGSNFKAYIGYVQQPCSQIYIMQDEDLYSQSDSSDINISSKIKYSNTDSAHFEIELQTYPNPFHEDVTIEFTTKKFYNQLIVYITDVSGRIVKELTNSTNNPIGKYSIVTNMNGCDSNVYVVVVAADGVLTTEKIIYKD